MNVVRPQLVRPRKTLEQQIDRLDHILDGLAEALSDAITDAVRDALQTMFADIGASMSPKPSVSRNGHRHINASVRNPVPTGHSR